VRTVALLGLEDEVASGAIRARLREVGWQVIHDPADATTASIATTDATTNATANATADASADASADVPTTRPDVWLVGGARSVAAVAAIVERDPAAGVILVTGEPSEEELVASIRAGARGYLVTEVDLDRLPTVLTAVAGGEASVPRSMTGLLARALRDRPPNRLRAGDRLMDLTDRETEVLGLLQGGRTTRQIADTLHVATVTVRTHIMTICRKARVADRSALLSLFKR